MGFYGLSFFSFTALVFCINGKGQNLIGFANVTHPEKLWLLCNIPLHGKHDWALYRWQYSNTLSPNSWKNLTPSSRIVVRTFFATIRILAFVSYDEKDAGFYRCIRNEDTINIVRVQVWRSPYFSSGTVIEKHVNESNVARLKCDAKGVPRPSVDWTFKPIHKYPFDGYDNITFCVPPKFKNVSELLLYNVSRYCEGNYYCLAKNAIEPAARKQISLFVNVSLTLSLRRQVNFTYLGDNVSLFCSINSNNVIEEPWWRVNGTYIWPNTTKHPISLKVSRTYFRLSSQLTVLNVQSRDYGKYSCGVRKINKTIDFPYIIDKPLRPTSAVKKNYPRIRAARKKYVLELEFVRSPFNLRCEISFVNSKYFTIFWKFKNSLINDKNKYNAYSYGSVFNSDVLISALRIYNFNRADLGVYECSFEDSSGKISDTIYIYNNAVKKRAEIIWIILGSVFVFFWCRSV